MAKTAAVAVDEPVVRAPRKRSGFDYSEGNQVFQRDASFWKYLENYPDTDGVSLYIFRLWPVIDNGLIGERNNYIEIIGEPAKWTREHIVDTWGGGQLMVKLIDSNARPSLRAKSFIKIDDPDIEPKLDLRTLCLHNSRNLDYVQKLVARGDLVREESGEVRLRTGEGGAARGSYQAASMSTGPNGNVNANVSAMAAQGGSLDSGLSPIVLSKIIERALASPDNTVKLALDMARMFQPPAAAAAPAAAPAAPAESLLEWIGVIREVRRLLKPEDEGRAAAAAIAAAADSGGGAVSWLSAVPGIIRELPTLVQAFAMMRGGSSGGGMPPPAAAPQVSTRAYVGAMAQPAAMPANGANGASPELHRTMQPQPAADMAMNDLPPELAGMFSADTIDKLQRVLPRAIESFRAGVPGLDCACGVIVYEGKPIFRVLDSIGPEGIMTALRGVPDPDIQALVAARGAELSAWVDDFLAYDIDGTAAE